MERTLKEFQDGLAELQALDDLADFLEEGSKLSADGFDVWKDKDADLFDEGGSLKIFD